MKGKKMQLQVEKITDSWMDEHGNSYVQTQWQSCDQPINLGSVAKPSEICRQIKRIRYSYI